MENSHTHYNYEAANLILDDLLDLETYQLMDFVNNENYNKEIINQINSKKLNVFSTINYIFIFLPLIFLFF